MRDPGNEVAWKGPWECYHERMSIDKAVCVTKNSPQVEAFFVTLFT